MKVFNAEDMLYPFVFLLQGDITWPDPVKAVACLRLVPHRDMEGYETCRCEVIRERGREDNDYSWVEIVDIANMEDLEPVEPDYC